MTALVKAFRDPSLNRANDCLYRAVKIVGFPLDTQSLVFDDDGRPHDFTMFAQANRVVAAYEEGPGDNVRRARWNSSFKEYGWDVLEADPTPYRDEGREDFHADG